MRLYLLLGALVIVTGIGVWVLHTNFKNNSSVAAQNAPSTSMTTEQNASTSQSEDYKTITDQNLGISFSIPKDWVASTTGTEDELLAFESPDYQTAKFNGESEWGPITESLTSRGARIEIYKDTHTKYAPSLLSDPQAYASFIYDDASHTTGGFDSKITTLGGQPAVFAGYTRFEFTNPEHSTLSITAVKDGEVWDIDYYYDSLSAEKQTIFQHFINSFHFQNSSRTSSWKLVRGANSINLRVPSDWTVEKGDIVPGSLEIRSPDLTEGPATGPGSVDVTQGFVVTISNQELDEVWNPPENYLKQAANCGDPTTYIRCDKASISVGGRQGVIYWGIGQDGNGSSAIYESVYGRLLFTVAIFFPAHKTEYFPDEALAQQIIDSIYYGEE